MRIPKIELKNGVKIPILGFGTYKLKGRLCEKAVNNALRLGYNHIDTAELYDNEEEIGNALKKFDRSKIFITSKVWIDNLDFNDVLKACDKSLKKLKTDYIDLYLIHYPDKRVPIKETIRALDKLYREGKIKAVGVSNFTISDIKEVMDVSDIPITVNQVEFHPLLYQRKLLEFCNNNEIFITAYSPIARGKVFENELLKKIANKHNKTPSQISLRWLIQKSIVVIPKATSVEHIKENYDIFNFELDEREMKEIDNVNMKLRLINPFDSKFDD